MLFINVFGEWVLVVGIVIVEMDCELVSKYYLLVLKVWLGDFGDGKYDGLENDFCIGIIWIKVDIVLYFLMVKNIFSCVGEVVQGVIIGQFV